MRTIATLWEKSCRDLPPGQWPGGTGGSPVPPISKKMGGPCGSHRIFHLVPLGSSSGGPGGSPCVRQHFSTFSATRVGRAVPCPPQDGPATLVALPMFDGAHGVRALPPATDAAPEWRLGHRPVPKPVDKRACKNQELAHNHPQMIPQTTKRLRKGLTGSLACPLRHARRKPKHGIMRDPFSGRTYQLQYKADLSQSDWISLGGTVTATQDHAGAADTIGPDQRRFYRVVLLP